MSRKTPESEILEELEKEARPVNNLFDKLIEEYINIGGHYTEGKTSGMSAYYWPRYDGKKYGRINISHGDRSTLYHEFMHMLDDYAEEDMSLKPGQSRNLFGDRTRYLSDKNLEELEEKQNKTLKQLYKDVGIPYHFLDPVGIGSTEKQSLLQYYVDPPEHTAWLTAGQATGRFKDMLNPFHNPNKGYSFSYQHCPMRKSLAYKLNTK